MNREEVVKRIEAHYRKNRERFSRLRAVGGRTVAEDVVQETYTRLLTYWKSFPENPAEEDPYVRRALRNTAHDLAREERQLGMSNKTEEPIVNCTGYSHMILAKIKDCIMEKPKVHAKAIYLVCFGQWSPAEVASETSLSEGNVRQLLFRFRNEIKEKFNWII